MTDGMTGIRARRTGARRYGWRDLAAVCGVLGMLLQALLGTAAAHGQSERSDHPTEPLGSLALQICSPFGLLERVLETDAGPGGVPANDPADDPWMPDCRGCLFHGSGLPGPEGRDVTRPGAALAVAWVERDDWRRDAPRRRASPGPRAPPTSI